MNHEINPELAALYDRGQELLNHAWSDNFHYGLWPDGEPRGPIQDATERLTDLVLQHFRVPPKARILDVGCGIGAPAFRLIRDSGASVTGISISRSEIAKANAMAASLGWADRATFVEASALDIPFDDGSLDGVLAFQSLMHMPDRDHAFKEISRVLKPGGAFTATDFYSVSPLTDEKRVALRHFAKVFHVTEELCSAEDYKARVARAGFVVETLIEVADMQCKRPTLLKLAEIFSGERKAQIDSLFRAGTAEAMALACQGMAQTPECGYMILGARRGRTS